MAEKKPLFETTIELISKEVGSSLRISAEGVRGIKADRINCWLQCLTSAQLTEAEAAQAYGTLRLVAISAREGGLRVADSLDEKLAALAREYNLPTGSV